MYLYSLAASSPVLYLPIMMISVGVIHISVQTWESQTPQHYNVHHISILVQ